MSELPQHRLFEQQIERIHRLVEGEGSKVKWNDRIADPDSPDKSRQIDVTITRDDSLTIVECRFRQSPQDVMWVEELIGRRLSLNADAVIAVSSSGFTPLAKTKAEKYGIILRDFQNLSEEEIRNWGKKRKLKLWFCEFSEASVTIRVPRQATSNHPSLSDNLGNALDPNFWRLVFQSLVRGLEEKKWRGEPASIRSLLVAENLRVNGATPSSIEFQGRVQRIVSEVSIASVVLYSDSISNDAQAEVGKFSLGDSELIEKADTVSAVFDLNRVAMPANCHFETILLDAGRPVRMKHVTVIGAPDVFNSTGSFNLTFEFV